MKFLLKLSVVLGVFFFYYPLLANQWIKTYSTAPCVGPEIYYMTREREGGARQSGTLYGVRLGYDHIQRYKLYSGVDALWATGIMDGHLHEEKLRSRFTDINVEVRLGFTFQSKFWRAISFSPYTGIGYFWEKNNYQHPSPLTIHFSNTFSYVPIGFLSQIFLTPNLSLGLNFKVRILLEGEQHVTHDPKNKRMTQHYDERLQYRAELPTTYFFCWKDHPLAISLVPFFEYRHYGHRANFPFDFFDTKLKLYGATLKLLYLF
jgi:hypothetical protein